MVEDFAALCGFGKNEQARDLEFDAESSTVYISTQQWAAPIAAIAAAFLAFCRRVSLSLYKFSCSCYTSLQIR
jgi:hypothetical protein